ncbi:MAG: hypothetical protein AAB481_03235 [Patescibacteria group bacterium]
MGDGTSEGGYYFNGQPTIYHDGHFQKPAVNEFDALIDDLAALARADLQGRIDSIRNLFPKKES